MAEKIYTLEQAAAKLGKKPEEFKEFAKQNNISELRKGPDILYKAKDVDALVSSGLDDTELNIEDSVIGLSDESSMAGLASLDEKDDDEFEIDADMSSMVELTEADTRAGIGEDKDQAAEDSVLSLADSVTEEPEAKINADADISAGGADGSGSGLLDLSLQADDSQFGAVLDDILPGGDNDNGGFDDFSDSVPSSGDAFASKAKAEKEPESKPVEDEEDVYTPEPVQVSAGAAVAAAPGAVVYQPVAAEDPASGTFGVMMLLPVFAIILAMIVVTAGFKAVTPSILAPIQDHIMYVIIGLAVLALIIGVVGTFAGQGGGEKKPKQVKEKAPKKPKKK